MVGLPDLHLVLGPSNDIWKNLKKLCPSEMKFLENKLNIKKSEYQGRVNYEGNQVKKILDNIPIIQETAPPPFHPLVDAFSCYC